MIETYKYVYKLSEVADLLGICPGTLRKHLWSQSYPGGMPFVKLGNRKTIFGEDLDAYLKKNRVGGESLQPVDIGG